MNQIKWNLKTYNISELTDYYKNPRQLTEKQFNQLKKSIDKFGLIDKPIINADEKHTVIGGHQRLRVLRAENKKSVECWYPSRELDEKEVEELNIRLNKNTGDWDFDTLANNFEVGDLMDWGFSEMDLGLYPEDEMPEDAEPQIDKAEELREKWQVQTGQLWQLGEHRIVCGDCTDKAVVDKVMQGERADMVFTDPPYGMHLDTDYSEIKGSKNAKIQGKGGRKYEPVIGDNDDFSPELIEAIFSNFGYCGEIFIWGADYFAELIPNRNDGSWVAWDKRGSEDADKIIGNCFELCWSKAKHKKEIARVKWMGAFGSADARERVHPTQKPLKLCEWFFNKYGGDGEVVADPFLGSGTTLIACERLGRKCRAVEISPAYVAVAIQRWVDVTGGKPEVVQ